MRVPSEHRPKTLPHGRLVHSHLQLGSQCLGRDGLREAIAADGTSTGDGVLVLAAYAADLQRFELVVYHLSQSGQSLVREIQIQTGLQLGVCACKRIFTQDLLYKSGQVAIQESQWQILPLAFLDLCNMSAFNGSPLPGLQPVLFSLVVTAPVHSLLELDPSTLRPDVSAGLKMREDMHVMCIF